MPSAAPRPAGAGRPTRAPSTLFKLALQLYDLRGVGFTLHQLRRSITDPHLAARGRSAAELQAKSRHRHLATLGIYVQLGEETSARITAENGERKSALAKEFGISRETVYSYLRNAAITG